MLLGSFGAFVALRSLEPAIFGAEKYMDFAFFNACLRAEHLPPEDPWFAGEPIHYYHFGYFLFANLARATGTPPEVAYHLSLATIGAILFSGAASIARALTGSGLLGLLGGALAAALGNLDGALQLLEGAGVEGFDYWRSSRIVAHAIDEFPFFSLLHGDLHPHVTALVVSVPLIALGTAARLDTGDGRSGALRRVLLPGFLAALLLSNPWEAPVAAAALGLLALARARSLGSAVREAAGLAALGVAGALLALPFARAYSPPFQGLGRVHAQTTVREFAVVFGGLLLPAFAWLATEIRERLPHRAEVREFTFAASALAAVSAYLATESAVAIAAGILALGAIAGALRGASPRESAARSLLAAGSLAVLACEILYVRDPYGPALHRMNTVFKLYFAAWVLFAIASPALGRDALRRLPGGPARGVLLALWAAAVLAAAAYPVASVAHRARTARLGLDGLRALDRDLPSDAEAIRWLRRNAPNGAVVLEATGDPYTHFSRVSANTGLPTLLGWANHEGIWRGADPRIAERRRHVERIYSTTDPVEARRLLRLYGVRYVFVGEIERRVYPAAGLAKFAGSPEGFDRVFQAGHTIVYEVRAER
jgi:YYY domain-containing protein